MKVTDTSHCFSQLQISFGWMFISAVIYSQRKLKHTTNCLSFLSSPHTTLPLGHSALCANFFFFLDFPLQQVVSAVRAGVNPSGNRSNQTSLWDISSSFFFAGTVITTIGKRSSFSPLLSTHCFLFIEVSKNTSH